MMLDDADGAICQYWRSIRDDAIRKKNGKLKERRVMTRRQLRVKRVRFSVAGLSLRAGGTVNFHGQF